MDASYAWSVEGFTRFMQAQGPDFLRETLNSAGGALGSVLVAKGTIPWFRRIWRVGKEPIPGLRKSLAAGIGCAVFQAVEDATDATASQTARDRYFTEEWWEEVDRQLLRPLCTAGAWTTFAQALVAPEVEEPKFLFREYLKRQGLDFDEVSRSLSLESDDFLYWLGPSVIIEIERLAVSTANSAHSLLEEVTAVRLRRYLGSHSEQILSPGRLRGCIRAFLAAVETRCEQYLENPYFAYGVSAQRVQQPARVRLEIRRNGQQVWEAFDPYVPLAARASEGKTRIVPWQEALDDGENIVVLADPGLGKTRLLYQHAHHLAREALRLLDDRVEPEHLVLPVLMRADQLHGHALDSLEEACVDVLNMPQLLIGRPTESAAFTTWIVEHLQTRKNVFLIDALDEIPGNRGSLPFGQKFVGWDEHPGGGQVILSSRITGYVRPHGLRVIEVELQPFNEDEVRSYVSAWGFDPKTHDRVNRHLQFPAFRGMARIPLLLAFICAVASQPESLPASRSELYERMLDQLLGEAHRLPERPDTTEQKMLSGVERDELRRILTRVAWHFSRTRSGWVDRMRAGELGQVVARAEPRVENVLDQCVRVGVLIQSGVNELSNKPDYYFLHRTLAEYLVAVASAAETECWQYVLEEHLRFAQDWEQVLPQIGAQLPDPEVYLDALLSVDPDPLDRGLHVAARVVAELSDEQVCRVHDQITEIVSRLIALVKLGACESVESLAAMAHRLPETEVRIIGQLVHQTEERIQQCAVTVLAQHSGNEATVGLLAVLADKNSMIREEAVWALAEREGETVTEGMVALLGDKTADFRIRETAAAVLAEREGETVTEGFVALLGDKTADSTVRRTAAAVLAEREGETVTEGFVALLGDKTADSTVRERAAAALTEREGPEVTEALLAVLADEDHGVWIAAAGALAGREGPEVTEALLAVLADEDHGVWVAAAVALAGREGSEVTEGLLAVLDDVTPRSEVRWAAAWALAGREGPEVTDALLVMLEDVHSGVRRAAVEALHGRQDERVTDALLVMLEDVHSGVRRAAVEALHGRQDERVTDALLVMLEDVHSGVRRAVVHALSGSEGSEATVALMKALFNEDFWIREAVARALADHEGLGVTEALLLALDDKDSWVRRAAARALTGRRGPGVTAALLVALDDKDLRVREATIRALTGRNDTEVIEALLAVLGDEESKLRQDALEALSGCQGQEVTAALIEAIIDDDPHVGVRAGRVLAQQPENDIVEGLRNLLDTCTPQQYLKIYNRIYPVAWSTSSFETAIRDEIFGLLGWLTDSLHMG